MIKNVRGYAVAATIWIILMQPIKTEAAEYFYDNQGRLIEIVYDNGNHVQYRYDKNGNMLEISEIREEETTTPEETSEPETSEPETSELETSEPETSEPETEIPEETATSGGGGSSSGGHKISGNNGGSQNHILRTISRSWQNLLTKWYNQNVNYYKQVLFKDFKQWLQLWLEQLQANSW